MKPAKNKLILVSFLALFLELSLIRWLPAHIFSIAFFSNIILIASFLGLGLGLLASSHKRNLFDFFPLILAGYILFILLLRNVQVKLPVDNYAWIWSYFYKNSITNISFLKLSITHIVILVFVFSFMVFVPIGQKIGKLMKTFKPLVAYTINILGSLLGIIAFAVITILHLPAYAWFFIAGIGILLVNYKNRNFLLNLFLLVAIVISIGFIEKDTTWSPYYAINTEQKHGKNVSVFVNKLLHQIAIDFENEPYLRRQYMLPYVWFSPKKMLIVGSGTGNDVWIAKKAGVKHIDAVEIDPVILKLPHPQKPYDNDNVNVFVDDARSFISKCSKKYDMVLYGTLDSHASLSTTSSIRIDNYVYTKEAFEDVKRLLTPKGVIVLFFSIPKDWVVGKLLVTIRDVFGQENTRYMAMSSKYPFNLMVIAGGGLKQALLQKTQVPKILSPVPANLNVSIPTDDWPYLYLSDRRISPLYSTTLIVIIAISLIAVFIISGLRVGNINFLFFFLGCGFLLLETKSVTTFSLLFGSTWMVNAVVFASIMAVILLVNWIVLKAKPLNPKWFFGGLMLSLIFLYCFPIAGILKFSPIMKIVIAGALIALPIFFSSLIFATVVKQTKDIRIALGSNLLGAVMGGFLEYSSMVWGLNTLYIIALVCYVIAAFCLVKKV